MWPVNNTFIHSHTPMFTQTHTPNTHTQGCTEKGGGGVINKNPTRGEKQRKATIAFISGEKAKNRVALYAYAHTLKHTHTHTNTHIYIYMYI